MVVPTGVLDDGNPLVWGRDMDAHSPTGGAAPEGCLEDPCPRPELSTVPPSEVLSTILVIGMDLSGGSVVALQEASPVRLRASISGPIQVYVHHIEHQQALAPGGQKAAPVA